MPSEKESKLQKLKDLLAKKKAERQKVLDGIYVKNVDYQESEAERFERIMNTPEAWTKL